MSVMFTVGKIKNNCCLRIEQNQSIADSCNYFKGHFSLLV